MSRILGIDERQQARDSLSPSRTCRAFQGNGQDRALLVDGAPPLVATIVPDAAHGEDQDTPSQVVAAASIRHSSP